MADQKVKVYDGSTWQDIESNAKLPIESEDGTVVLSDSSGSFVVSNGNPSATRLTVADDAATFTGDVRASKIVGTAYSTDASVELTSDLDLMANPRNGHVNITAGTIVAGSPSISMTIFSSVLTWTATPDSDSYNETNTPCKLGKNASILTKDGEGGLGFAADTIRFNTSGSPLNWSWSIGDDGNLVGRSGNIIEAAGLVAGRDNASEQSIIFDAVGNIVITASGNDGDINLACTQNGSVSITSNEESLEISGVPSGSDTDTTPCGIAEGNCFFQSDSSALAFIGDKLRFNGQASSGLVGFDWEINEGNGNLIGANNREIQADAFASSPYGTGDARIAFSVTDANGNLQATLTKKDSSPYAATLPDSLMTKRGVDDEISQAIAANQGDTTLGAGTPTSETTPDEAPGSMLFDENYLWLKTNTVWKKIPLAGFNSPAATATVQVSQAQYDALNPKDPNTLYIIVG